MKVFLFVAATLLTFNANADDYQTQIDRFFKLYKNAQINEAVDAIYSSNRYSNVIEDQIANKKVQLSELQAFLGSIHHIDKINTYQVGENFVHVTYLVIYDKQPIRYEFQFFQVEQGWRTYSFSYDDNVTSEISTLARQAALSACK